MESLRQVIKDIKYQSNRPTKPIVTKEYIYHLQSEIDSLEDQLCIKYELISPFIVNSNRDNNNSNNQSSSNHRNHKKHNREREEYKEKQMEGEEEHNHQIINETCLCKELENKTLQLENNMNKMLLDKEDQANRIKQLQNEIDELRRKKEEKIEKDRAKLEQQFNQ